MSRETIPAAGRSLNPSKGGYDTYLFHGDYLENMRELDDASVDMILCDLPYQLPTG